VADQARESERVVADLSRAAMESDPDSDSDHSDRTVLLVEFLASRSKTLANPLSS